MKPIYEEMLGGATKWRKEFQQIPVEVLFHGWSNDLRFPHPGIWCYYLLLSEEMFSEEDWNKLWLEESIGEFGGSFYCSYGYENLPELGFHGGITWYSRERYWSQGEGKWLRALKIGCDYNHLWDKETGYPDSLESVLRDAEQTVEKLCFWLPNHRRRCEYSGKWGEAAEFYEAKNGKLVHKSQEGKFSEGWENWLPKGAS